MRRIQLKHFSPASCWSEFSLCGCSCGKSWVPHISGIFQLCLGCLQPPALSPGARWLWARPCFVFKLSWLPGLNACVLGGVVFDREMAGSFSQSHRGHCSQWRAQNWGAGHGSSASAQGRTSCGWRPRMGVQPHGRGSPKFQGLQRLHWPPAPWQGLCPARRGGTGAEFILGLLWQLCRVLQSHWCWGALICLSLWHGVQQAHNSLCSQELHSVGTDFMRRMPSTHLICHFLL